MIWSDVLPDINLVMDPYLYMLIRRKTIIPAMFMTVLLAILVSLVPLSADDLKHRHTFQGLSHPLRSSSIRAKHVVGN